MRCVLLALAVAGMGVFDAHAQQFVPTGRDTLRGLPGVEVIVEPIAPELAQAGVTTAAIRANVDRQLRTAGITVYASQMENASPAKPYLYVHVSGLPVARQGFSLVVRVEVRQTLRSSVTNSNIVNAMTWDQQAVLFALPGSGVQGVLGEVQALVAQFVLDWRAVH
jgi:hypothetical protein